MTVTSRKKQRGSSGRSAALASAVAALAGAAVQAQTGELLLDDGELTRWTTRAQVEGTQVSGSPQSSGGNPGAHYRVVHRHQADAPFSPHVASESFFTGDTFDLSAFAPEDVLVVTLDHQAEEDPTPFDAPTELGWLPLIRQRGETSRLVELTQRISLGGGFGSGRVSAPLESFRPALDLSPGAPAAELGFVLQSAKVVGAVPKEVRIRIDNYRARVDVSGAPREGILFSVSDGGHLWANDPLIPYELTVENSGPPETGVVLTEIVPVNTRFDREASSPGWSCDPGPDEGSLCTFPVGDLASGARHSAVFAVRVLPGTPERFEVLTEAGFADAAARAGTRSHATCERQWTTTHDDCALFAIAGSSAPHVVSCSVQTYTPSEVACCFIDFTGFECDTHCTVTCNAPCEDVDFATTSHGSP